MAAVALNVLCHAALPAGPRTRCCPPAQPPSLRPPLLCCMQVRMLFCSAAQQRMAGPAPASPALAAPGAAAAATRPQLRAYTSAAPAGFCCCSTLAPPATLAPRSAQPLLQLHGGQAAANGGAPVSRLERGPLDGPGGATARMQQAMRACRSSAQIAAARVLRVLSLARSRRVAGVGPGRRRSTAIAPCLLDSAPGRPPAAVTCGRCRLAFTCSPRPPRLLQTSHACSARPHRAGQHGGAPAAAEFFRLHHRVCEVSLCGRLGRLRSAHSSNLGTACAAADPRPAASLALLQGRARSVQGAAGPVLPQPYRPPHRQRCARTHERSSASSRPRRSSASPAQPMPQQQRLPPMCHLLPCRLVLGRAQQRLVGSSAAQRAQHAQRAVGAQPAGAACRPPACAARPAGDLRLGVSFFFGGNPDMPGQSWRHWCAQQPSAQPSAQQRTQHMQPRRCRAHHALHAAARSRVPTAALHSCWRRPRRSRNVSAHTTARLPCAALPASQVVRDAQGAGQHRLSREHDRI